MSDLVAVVFAVCVVVGAAIAVSFGLVRPSWRPKFPRRFE